jgi:hypothetical protein
MQGHRTGERPRTQVKGRSASEEVMRGATTLKSQVKPGCAVMTGACLVRTETWESPKEASRAYVPFDRIIQAYGIAILDERIPYIELTACP